MTITDLVRRYLKEEGFQTLEVDFILRRIKTRTGKADEFWSKPLDLVSVDDTLITHRVMRDEIIEYRQERPTIHDN